MILSDFRYQDPWAKAEEAYTLPKLFHQNQLQQRDNQQAEVETPRCLAASAKVPGVSNRARRGITLLLHNFYIT